MALCSWPYPFCIGSWLGGRIQERMSLYNFLIFSASLQLGETKIVGKLFVGQDHWDLMADARNRIEPGTQATVTGDLLFYDREGHYLGNAPLKEDYVAKGDQVKDFVSWADHDVSGYAFVSLANVGPVPHYMQVPPDVSNADPTARLSVGDFRFFQEDGFTKVQGWVSLKKEGFYRYVATLTFFDEVGREMGSADLISTGRGAENSL